MPAANPPNSPAGPAAAAPRACCISNQSDSFRPAEQIYLNLHLELLPNPSGKGKDYGLSVNLLDGKLVARLNKYSTLQLNSRDGSTRTLAQRVRGMDFTTTYAPQGLTN